MPEVNRHSEITDTREQFQMLISYSGEPCAALKSDLRKSLECLTEFVNVPGPSGTVVGAAGARRAAGDRPQTRTTMLFRASGRPCCPRGAPNLFFQSPIGPCGLFINCLKLQEISGYQ